MVNPSSFDSAKAKSPIQVLQRDIYLKSGKTGYWDILYIYLLAKYPFLHLFMLTSQ